MKTIKKIVVKMLIATLLLGSMGTFAINLNNASAATKTVIHADPSKTKTLGWTFSTTETISRSELYKISKYFDRHEANKTAHAGVAGAILSAPISPYLTVPASAAPSMISAYTQTHGQLVSYKLKKSSKKTFKVKINYKYRQAGSNQGYYFIDSINIY